MRKQGKLFIISAPSGAGKTSLVHALIKEHGTLLNIYRVITYTTKQPRPGEMAGVDYHYLSHEEFLQKKEEGFFLEVTDGLGHFYGTPRDILEECYRGKSPILIIDREGARTIKAQCPEAVCIWIHVPSLEQLMQRLRSRGADSAEQIARRIARAEKEMKEEGEVRFYTHHVTNDIFENAFNNLTKIIKDELGIFVEK